MTVRAAQVIFAGGNRFQTKRVIDRLQTVTPGLNIPNELIREIGNAQTVADVRDSPELSFDIETLDVNTEFEALLLGLDPTTIADGTELDLLNAKPLDIISPFKRSLTQFDIVKGLAYPHLALESATYRFGVQQNSTESFTMRGDSIYYIPGTPYFEVFPAAGVGPYNFANTSIKTVEQGADLYAYSVTLCLADGTYTRLFLGQDFTNDANGFTLETAAPAGSFLHVVYGSTTADNYDQTVHEGVSIKPGAVRGSYIDVYVSNGAATPQMILWKGLQSAEVNWRLTLDPTRELGNTHIVSYDYDPPDLTGTLTMRPETVNYFFDRVAQVTGVPTNETINANSTVALDMQIVINHPVTRQPIKTLVVDQARFVPPAGPTQVNTRVDVPFAFTSDTGSLKVVKGLPA